MTWWITCCAGRRRNTCEIPALLRAKPSASSRLHARSHVSPSRRGPGTFSLNIPLNERRLSSNSTKVSSGDVSPYDNNSPVLSDGLMGKYPDHSDPFAHSAPRLSFTVHSTEGSSGNPPTLSTDKGEGLFFF